MRIGPASIACSLIACVGLAGQGSADATGISREGGALVPVEEYPVFDRVVESKFLTSATRLVVIERSTVTRLRPDVSLPPTYRWFDETRPFDGRLPADLIRDFVAKNQQPSRLEPRFGFGVHVRFVTPEGLPEPEVRLAPAWEQYHAHLMQATPETRQNDLRIVHRLGFSRVAFNLRGNEAMVYVTQERPDEMGAGFLVRLHRDRATWTVVETETLWVAHPDDGHGVGP